MKNNGGEWVWLWLKTYLTTMITEYDHLIPKCRCQKIILILVNHQFINNAKGVLEADSDVNLRGAHDLHFLDCWAGSVVSSKEQMRGNDGTVGIFCLPPESIFGRCFCYCWLPERQNPSMRISLYPNIHRVSSRSLPLPLSLSLCVSFSLSSSFIFAPLLANPVSLDYCQLSSMMHLHLQLCGVW